MSISAHTLLANIVLWCTILNLRTLKSFCLIIFYQGNFCIYYFEVALKPRCVRETLRLMFLSRRRLLTKRLWSLRVVEDETTRETEDLPEGNLPVRTGLLKRLAEHQLELLIQAVKSRGADLSACILLPQDEHQPHMLSCKLWRWPDLRDATHIRRLPGCRSVKDPVYICCNPYHWSRLCEPESPPPPYYRSPSECFKPEDRAPSEGSCDPLRGEPSPGSLTTQGEGDGGPEWCRLAYWEMSTRVGRQFPVVPPAVNVFTCLPHGDGLCLETLAQAAPWPPPDPVRRTREKIGLGITLSYEPDGVWVYNRSESPIFVNSPTLDDPSCRSLLVHKVPPGYCMNIFDRTRTPTTQSRFTPTYTPTGPVDPFSVRISFAKGWGPKYTRQDVTSCPCWLEVLLKHPCR